MGGFDGYLDELHSEAIASHEEIHALDDRTRQELNDFLLSNPGHNAADSNCKDVQILLIMWKFESKLGDLMKNVEECNDALTECLDLLRVNAWDTEEELTSDLNYLHDLLSEHSNTDRVNRVRQLRSMIISVKNMMKRLTYDYIQTHENPTKKKILNPYLNIQILVAFENRMHDLVLNAFGTFCTFHQLKSEVCNEISVVCERGYAELKEDDDAKHEIAAQLNRGY